MPSCLISYDRWHDNCIVLGRLDKLVELSYRDDMLRGRHFANDYEHFKPALNLDVLPQSSIWCASRRPAICCIAELRKHIVIHSIMRIVSPIISGPSEMFSFPHAILTGVPHSAFELCNVRTVSMFPPKYSLY